MVCACSPSCLGGWEGELLLQELEVTVSSAMITTAFQSQQLSKTLSLKKRKQICYKLSTCTLCLRRFTSCSFSKWHLHVVFMNVCLVFLFYPFTFNFSVSSTDSMSFINSLWLFIYLFACLFIYLSIYFYPSALFVL